MVQIALIALAVLGAQDTIKRDLPAGSKPVLQLPMFKGMTPISASEYKTKESPHLIRVYRYTYRADYQKELERLRRLLPKKDGWEEQGSIEQKYFGFDRPSNDKRVSRQALIYMPHRWVPKAGVHGGVAPKKEPGWVSFSYNEELR